MKGLYCYRNEMIQKTPCNKGWYFKDDINVDIYKTIEDAKNAIDKRDGLIPENNGREILKRYDKPIKVIGKMTFVVDNISDGGKVQSHFEYEWFV
jgi:hypothetical protein